ncbi:MAG: thioredoxin domain-containing protein [Candidatus Komeilibacteria bacterium]
MNRKWLTIIFIVFLLTAAVAVIVVRRIRFASGRLTEVKQSFQPVVVDPEDPVLGQRQAAVTVITFSSFSCPACKRNADTLQQIVARYPDRVRLVWKDLPEDDASRQLALAARCAQNQGQFWQYHDGLFARQGNLVSGSTALVNMAGNLGLDRDLFTVCLSEQQPLDLVERSVAEAVAANISAVPYSEVNGTIRVEGELSLSEWQTIIEQR